MVINYRHFKTLKVYAFDFCLGNNQNREDIMDDLEDIPGVDIPILWSDRSIYVNIEEDREEQAVKDVLKVLYKWRS